MSNKVIDVLAMVCATAAFLILFFTVWPVALVMAGLVTFATLVGIRRRLDRIEALLEAQAAHQQVDNTAV